eukprot:1049517-Pyramimonas_sp.AAC.2
MQCQSGNLVFAMGNSCSITVSQQRTQWRTRRVPQVEQTRGTYLAEVATAREELRQLAMHRAALEVENEQLAEYIQQSKHAAMDAQV